MAGENLTRTDLDDAHSGEMPLGGEGGAAQNNWAELQAMADSEAKGEVNLGAGENVRTLNELMDVYPRGENESDEEYNNKLRKIMAFDREGEGLSADIAPVQEEPEVDEEKVRAEQQRAREEAQEEYVRMAKAKVESGELNPDEIDAFVQGRMERRERIQQLQAEQREKQEVIRAEELAKREAERAKKQAEEDAERRELEEYKAWAAEEYNSRLEEAERERKAAAAEGLEALQDERKVLDEMLTNQNITVEEYQQRANELSKKENELIAQSLYRETRYEDLADGQKWVEKQDRLMAELGVTAEQEEGSGEGGSDTGEEGSGETGSGEEGGAGGPESRGEGSGEEEPDSPEEDAARGIRGLVAKICRVGLNWANRKGKSKFTPFQRAMGFLLTGLAVFGAGKFVAQVVYATGEDEVGTENAQIMGEETGVKVDEAGAGAEETESGVDALASNPDVVEQIKEDATHATLPGGTEVSFVQEPAAVETQEQDMATAEIEDLTVNDNEAIKHVRGIANGEEVEYNLDMGGYVGVSSWHNIGWGVFVANFAEAVSGTMSIQGTQAEKNQQVLDVLQQMYGGENGTDLIQEKTAFYNLSSPLMSAEQMEGKSDAEITKGMVESLARVSDDPIMISHFLGFLGANLQFSDMDETVPKGVENLSSISSLEDMSDLYAILNCDDAAREFLANHTVNLLAHLAETYQAQRTVIHENEVYGSIYAMVPFDQGKDAQLHYYWDGDVVAEKDIEVLQFMDGDQNVLDTNEIGGYKYNYLKAVGLIPANATDSQATYIMEGYRILGLINDCGGGQTAVQKVARPVPVYVAPPAAPAPEPAPQPEEQEPEPEPEPEDEIEEEVTEEEEEEPVVPPPVVPDTPPEGTPPGGTPPGGTPPDTPPDTPPPGPGPQEELKPKTNVMVPDDGATGLGPTVEGANTGDVLMQGENRADEAPQGGEVDVVGTGERVAGADAITSTQGTSSTTGGTLVDADSGDVIVTDTGVNGANITPNVEDLTTNAAAGVESAYSDQTRESAAEQYGDGGPADTASNANVISQQPAQDLSNSASAGVNDAAMSESDAGALFNMLNGQG